MRATNFVKASYSEIIDLQTVSGKTTVIGIHTPQGDRPIRRLAGFFRNFRQWKYLGCSLKMVPAANLPVDPLGLTGVPGTTDLMDPRDMLNPIITHGCHGESLSSVLNVIYRSTEQVRGNGINQETSTTPELLSDSHVSSSVNSLDMPNADDSALSEYYNCLTDVTWKKWGIQNGVSLSGLHPLVHKLGMNHPVQPVWYGNNLNGWNETGIFSAINTSVSTTVTPSGVYLPGISGATSSDYSTVASMQMMTSGMMRLGWLPTVVQNADGSHLTLLPKLFMACMILPPSYNVEQYFRMVITHRFAFRGFTTSLGVSQVPDSTVASSSNNTYFNWIDYSTSSTQNLDRTLSPIDEGTSVDMIDGKSEVIADGVR